MKVYCPSRNCRAENVAPFRACVRCGLPLEGYARLLAFPAALFNQGLAAARSGHLSVARDCFAAVVRWCPFDSETRAALASACFALNDVDEARRQWQILLDASPNDGAAQAGITACDQRPSSAPSPVEPNARPGRKRRSKGR